MEVLGRLLKIPNLIQTFEDGQSCSLRDCPFFKSCPGADRSITPNWHGSFICDIKALKEVYQNGEKNKSGDKKHQEDLFKFYGKVRPTKEKMQT